MVTCPKCGTKNPNEANFCVSCGSTLLTIEEEKKRSTYFRQPDRREDECFGLPHGGAIIGLFIGLIIIVAGLGNKFLSFPQIGEDFPGIFPVSPAQTEQCIEKEPFVFQEFASRLCIKVIPGLFQVA